MIVISGAISLAHALVPVFVSDVGDISDPHTTCDSVYLNPNSSTSSIFMISPTLRIPVSILSEPLGVDPVQNWISFMTSAFWYALRVRIFLSPIHEVLMSHFLPVPSWIRRVSVTSPGPPGRSHGASVYFLTVPVPVASSVMVIRAAS